GEFAGTNVAYRGVRAVWARSTFTYTNLVWDLPDLQVGRPEGTLLLAHRANDGTRDYQWHIRGPIDPNALRPLLSSNQLKGLDLVRFESPVVVEGSVFGRFNEHERIGFDLSASVSNVAVRGHTIDTLETHASYTNLVLELFKPVITRGAQWMYADGIAVNFTMQRIHFTNGFSMADAQAVADAIGPKVGKALQPYRFIHPPVAKVEGFAPLRGSEDADLRFEVEGGPFEWWKFKLPRIEGVAHWKGHSLLLTNVTMDFYGGDAGGHAFFNFIPDQGADFQFALNVTNSDFHSLMTDIASPSNRMSGVLSGQLIVNSASTIDPFSWNGRGKVKLEDGYLWDIPLFGVFSPILNNIVPGMGGGHASDAKANFIITNGVVFSDSLDIRSTMMRLKYDGTVDFAGTVDARVEAELLRDAWLVGRALSFVFKPVTKLLEYRVTGTLSKPKPEPLYFIPRLLMFPLHPIRTLEEILPSTSSSTNAPATKP
ncbi:MAG TPA: AsmA-like C-terminal region-containing protein, partial [Verrucomicrobiota bacterium]|nr:AsmA-like C-terminal region-containing protein [Verrucomicrobiota bacterium]